MDANATATRPGRQRSAACDSAILEATLQLLSETGYAGLTIAAVIERSGVSSATCTDDGRPSRPRRRRGRVSGARTRRTPTPVRFAGDLGAFVRHVARAISVRQEEVADALEDREATQPRVGGSAP